MGVSGNLWIVVKDVKSLVVYDVECKMAIESVKGKCASSWVDLGYTNLFCIPEVTSVFFSCCDSVLGDSLQFHQGNRSSLHLWLGTRNSSARNAGESGLILRRGGTHMSFLELRQAPGIYSRVRWEWPFETWVCSAKSGLLSSYDGHLRKLNYAWQENTDTSWGEPVGQAFLINWHSYIGIPINFHEVSGIVTFWSTELSAPLEVSNECEDLCPEDVENYGFF